MLCRRGYVLKKGALSPDELEAIRHELTVEPYIPDDFKRPSSSKFKVFLESESSMFLPKFYALSKFGKPAVNKLTYTGIDISFNGSLRAEQKEPVDAFLKAAYDPLRMGGILNMQCAAGKTVMAIYIICTLATKTLVIVHKEFLIQQWKERILEFAPNARIGLIKAKTIDVDDKDIVLASLQSLSMKDYPKETFEGFGLVVVDECHHTGAEVFSKALQKVTSAYSLGLSATVKRKDGLSKVFMWHLGGIVYSKKSKGKDTIDIHMLTFPSDDLAYCEECTLFGRKPNMAKMINNICEYQPRIVFTVDCIAQTLVKDPNRRILVLSDRRNHLQLLYDQLKAVGFMDVGFYYGGMKQEDLKKSESCKIILGTYSMISEGFDVKGLDTLVLASPKSDIVQSVGRILREKPENRKHVPLVIDIVDDFSMFSGQAKKRLDYYLKCKYNITSEKKQTTVKEVQIEQYAFT